MLSVLAAILLLGILITVHEFGHFIAARLTGIEVKEFAIGFGPKIVGWKSKKKETAFSLRCIPLGGFCAFYGEDDVNGNEKDDPRNYNNQSVWKRMFTVINGPLMNFVLALVVAVGYYFFTGVPEMEPYITGVDEVGPAMEAGLQANDVIESVNGQYVLDGTTDTLIAAINQPGLLTLVVRRGEETFETTCTPFLDEAENRYRIGMTLNVRATGVVHHQGLGQAIADGWNYCVYAGRIIVESLVGLVTRGEGLDQTSGPVGVVTVVSQQVRDYGLEAFINFLVIISVNLGLMNLLPIPGLDGSRFLFMAVEAVRRKPISRDKEAMIHLVGMVFLFGLMIFFTFKDVMRLFQ